jgi:hypothetical protein
LAIESQRQTGPQPGSKDAFILSDIDRLPTS